MGGIDKCLLPWRGGTILSRLLEQIPLPCALNVAPPIARFSAYPIPMISDLIAGQLGPLAGIHAGLCWARDQGFLRLITLPSDGPELPKHFFERLVFDSDRALGPVVLVRDGCGRVQPILGNWSIELIEPIEQALVEGTRQVRTFTQALGEHCLDFNEPILNINTREDYEQNAG